MATIQLKSGIGPLSGTFGGLLFSQRGGKQRLYVRPTPRIPENATPEQQRRIRRLQTIDECVSKIQSSYPDPKAAIRDYNLIRQRVCRLYDKLAPTFRPAHKLRWKIITEYENRYRINPV